MICPHCGIGTSPQFREATIGSVLGARVNTKTGNCTECKDIIIFGE